MFGFCVPRFAREICVLFSLGSFQATTNFSRADACWPNSELPCWSADAVTSWVSAGFPLSVSTISRSIDKFSCQPASRTARLSAVRSGGGAGMVRLWQHSLGSDLAVPPCRGLAPLGSLPASSSYYYSALQWREGRMGDRTLLWNYLHFSPKH